MGEFIPVGITAMRDPKTGELLEAVPLYVEARDAENLPMIDAGMFIQDIRKRIMEKTGQKTKPADAGTPAD